MRHEDELIRRIARALPSAIGRATGDVALGIGDDAAVLNADGHLQLVMSCDAFVEGVHFLRRVHPSDSVGFKSLARATSDLAAMGARPRFFLLTLSLPKSMTGSWLDEFLRGMKRAARSLRMFLIGGDTTIGTIVSAGVTVIGQVAAGKALGRFDARPGDSVYVSGRLGDAQLGLELALKLGKKTAATKGQGHETMAAILRPHLYPRIPVDLGLWLADNRIPSAMMDLSDGLSTDLARLCAASRVGARVLANQIPQVRVPKEIEKLLPRRGSDSLQRALHGGEDYELLFTVSPRKERQLRQYAVFAKITRIGQITRHSAGPRVMIVGEDGKTSPLHRGGWDPFV